MDDKLSLEEQMKRLKQHFGAIVATVKDLKQKYEAQNAQIKEIVEIQGVVDEVVVTNSDAIKHIKNEMLVENSVEETNEENVHNPKTMREVIETQQGMDKTISKNSDTIKELDKEIKCILKEKNCKDVSRKRIDDAISRLDQEIKELKKENVSTEEVVSEKEKTFKRCRYHNTGYCKYKEKCRFTHPEVVCKDQQCEGKRCDKRHPKACKWMEREEGCRRKDHCKYSHDIPENKTFRKGNTFKCASCKHAWSQSKFVVKHELNNMQVFFCLNCEDWVQDKSKVLEDGWALFDQAGNLRYDV